MSSHLVFFSFKNGTLYCPLSTVYCPLSTVQGSLSRLQPEFPSETLPTLAAIVTGQHTEVIRRRRRKISGIMMTIMIRMMLG